MATSHSRSLWLPLVCALLPAACSDSSSGTAADASPADVARDTATVDTPAPLDAPLDQPAPLDVSTDTSDASIASDAPSASDAADVSDASDASDAADASDASDAPPACATGQARCGGMCVDVQSDVMRCGGCDVVCASRANATATCSSGACGSACNAGFGDCDGDASNGCEAPLDTASNCGRCGSACAAGTMCSAGTCASVCAAGTTYCAGACVSLATSPTHCGDCSTVCATPTNALATCTAGVCGSVCNTGFGNCDGSALNGCETALATALAHCGRCGNTCTAGPHATATCAAGACGLTCDAGFADCDGNAANGCESDLTSAAACGRCGNTCAAGQVCRAGACATPRHASFVYVPGAGTVHVYSPTTNSVRLSLDTGAATATALPTLALAADGVRSAAVPRDGVLRAEGDGPFIAWVHDGASGDKVTFAGDLNDRLRGTDLYTWAGSHVTVFTTATAPSTVRVQRLSETDGAAVDLGTWTPGADQHRSFSAGGVSGVYRITATGAPVTASGQLLTETYNHFAYVPADDGTLSGTSFRYAEPAGAPGIRRMMVQSFALPLDVTFRVGSTTVTRRLDAGATATSIDFPADTLVQASTSGAALAWIEADPNNGCDGTLLDAELVPSVRGSTYDTEWVFRTNLAVSGCYTTRRADVDVIAYANNTVVELYAAGATAPAARETIQRGQRLRVLTDAEPNRYVRLVTSQPARVEMSHDSFQFVVRAPSITTFE